jgi:hypothetical protein
MGFLLFHRETNACALRWQRQESATTTTTLRTGRLLTFHFTKGEQRRRNQNRVKYKRGSLAHNVERVTLIVRAQYTFAS